MNRQFIALSGLAMVLIVLNHAIHMSLDIPARLGYAIVDGWPRFALTVLQALGVFAVPVFLFISGAFIAYAGRTASSPSWKFVWAGLRNILWPYLIWSVVFYIVILIQHGEQYAISGYIKNLLVGYPFHFIPLLAFFYLISPLLLPLARRYGALLLLTVALFQLVLLNIREPGLFGFHFSPVMDYLYPPVLGQTFADWGIYFPMGMVFSLHAARLKPFLSRFKWLFAGAAAALFITGLMDAQNMVQAPWARFICPFPFIFVIPVISRGAIPFVSRLEQIGKRSYGLYLTHLIVIDLVLVALRALWPGLLDVQLLLAPLLFVAGLIIPLYLMNLLAEQAPGRKVFRYVFG